MMTTVRQPAPITSYRDFWRRACRMAGPDRNHVADLWRRGHLAEAIHYVEERTQSLDLPASAGV